MQASTRPANSLSDKASMFSPASFMSKQPNSTPNERFYRVKRDRQPQQIPAIDLRVLWGTSGGPGFLVVVLVCLYASARTAITDRGSMGR